MQEKGGSVERSANDLQKRILSNLKGKNSL